MDEDELLARFKTIPIGTIDPENGPRVTKHYGLDFEFQRFAAMLNVVLPAGRTKSLTMTALEEASNWAHKSIDESGGIS